MTVPLPSPLARYFAASNRHDIDAMLAPFAPGAEVRDEGATHVGTAAIRDWMEHTTAKYRVTSEVIDLATKADTLVVTARVSGNFPGSPANLTYRFTLKGDAIGSLSIG